MTQPEILPIKAVIAPVTPLQQNCTIVWCVKTMKAAVIDPGGEVGRLLGAIENQGLTLEKIWITHGHMDHAGGAAALKDATGAPIEGPHPADQFWIDRIPESGQRYGMPDARAFTPDRCKVLDLLCAQAAISLENARLYETLDSRVKERTEELTLALDNLQQTQRQLVLQEKLASLGMLTSGIAHEIKNPLNFINNFAELSVNLSSELVHELARSRPQLDPDRAARLDELVAELGPGETGRRAWAQAVGTVPVAAFTVTKLRWLAENEPDSAKRVAAVCLPHDWLTWRLSGYGPAGQQPTSGDVLERLVTDRGDASGAVRVGVIEAGDEADEGGE